MTEKQVKSDLSLPLREYDYSQENVHFITICTYRQKCLFGEINDTGMILNDFGKIVAEMWEFLPQKYPEVTLDVFVVMPNHFHGILIVDYEKNQTLNKIKDPILREKERNDFLSRIVKHSKLTGANKINQILQSKGKQLWQINYDNHIIRDEIELEKIREYIINNPLRWFYDIANPDKNPDDYELNFWEEFGRKDLLRK
jgi:putative transposase